VTTLKLHLTDPQGLPLDGVHIVSSASMTNMDMVTHQESVSAIGSGTYIATLGLSILLRLATYCRQVSPP
jgi:hypothetical protein